ncbi:mechanosensitive ion channel [Methylococcaceae bacterium WWC4]|nr:mechanosensitive ion channel [Methylococcaceae bacterium WWC4]
MAMDSSALLSQPFLFFETPIFTLGTQSVNVIWLAKFTLCLGLMLLVVRWIRHILNTRLLVGLVVNEGDRKLIANLAGFTLLAVGIVAIMQVMGINFETLALIFGGLGVAVGFGLQDITKNIASGITLMSERKLKVGDLIYFAGGEGRIRDIFLRSTVITSFQGSELIIPNVQLTNNIVEKWGYQAKRGRVEVPVVVEQHSNLVLVTELLLKAAGQEPNVLSDPVPKALLQGFGDIGLNFELWVWTDHIDQRSLIRSALNFRIEYLFRLHAIKIPYHPTDNRSLYQATDAAANPINGSLEAASMPSIHNALIELPYFQYFDELEIRELIEKGSPRYFNPGDILVKQDEYFPFFCVMLKGEVDAIFENEKVSQRLFSLQHRDFFGELPLLLNIPYPTSMRAVGEVVLFTIPEDCFADLLSRYPRIKAAVSEEMLKRQEYIRLCQSSLKKMGLLPEEFDNNPVTWLKSRLMKLWGN